MPVVIAVNWADGLTAVATAIQALLVLIALLYARRQLDEARKTRMSNARSADEFAVRRLIRATRDTGVRLHLWAGCFEDLGEGGRWPIKDIEVGAKAAEEISDRIHAIYGELPDDLVTRALKTVIALETAVKMAIAIEAVDLKVRLGRSMATGDEGWSWDTARTVYVSEVRDQISERPEWEDVLSGEAMEAADAAVKALNDAARAWLSANRDAS